MNNILSAIFELLYNKGIITSTECEYVLKIIRSNDTKDENIYYAIKDIIEGDIDV